MTCDNCPEPATVHLAETKNRRLIQRHLCEACGAAAIEPAVPVEVVSNCFAVDPCRPGGRGDTGG